MARLSVEGAEFWVADESPPHMNFSPETLNPGSVRLVMVVNDPDGPFARAVEAGDEAIRPVSNEYGWRIGRLVDSYGHPWEIGKPLSVEFAVGSLRDSSHGKTSCSIWGPGWNLWNEIPS